MSAAAPLTLLMGVRRVWDRLAVYLPLLLMGLMAMTTYWLVRNTPVMGEAAVETAPRHVPDYFMHNFSVKVFAVDGRLKSELVGTEGRHFPDTDTLEISNVTLRRQNANGQRDDVFNANSMLLNSKTSEYQLSGQVRGVISPGKP